MTFACSGLRGAVLFNPLRIDSQLDRFHQRLAQNRIEPVQQLSTHVFKLVFPNTVGNNYQQRAVLQLNRYGVTAQSFTDSMLPRGDTGSLANLFASARGLQYRRQGLD